MRRKVLCAGLAACIAALIAVSACLGKSALRNAPSATTTATSAASISALEERLKANGFAKVEEGKESWTYKKDGITLSELAVVLGLKSAADFRLTVNSSPYEWHLLANVANDVFCDVVAPTADRLGGFPPESTRFTATVAKTAPLRKIRLGAGPGSVEHALSPIGAKRLSTSAARIEGLGGKEDNLYLETYALPDGRLCQILYRSGFKREWYAIAIFVDRKGGQYDAQRGAPTALDLAAMNEVQELSLEDYMGTNAGAQVRQSTDAR